MEAIAIVLGSATAGGCALLALIMWLQRRNAVSRRSTVAVPLRWHWSMSRAARRHRHLVQTVRVMRCVVPEPRKRERPTMIHELADEFERLADELDRALLLASPLRGAAYRNRLAHLDHRSSTLEQSMQRLAGLVDGTSADSGVPWEERLRRADERLGAHENAWQELRLIDATEPVDAASAPTVRLQAPSPTTPLHRFTSWD